MSKKLASKSKNEQNEMLSSSRVMQIQAGKTSSWITEESNPKQPLPVA
jgi:hypothetical protein